MGSNLFDAGGGRAWRIAAVACSWLATSCGAKSRAAASPTAGTAPSASSASIAPEPTVELPKTNVGDLARSLVDVVNRGKPDEQREFVRKHFSAKALEDGSLDEYAAFVERMWTQSGGIDVVEIFPPRGPNGIWFGVRSRRGRLFANLAIVAASAESDRIDEFYCNPFFDPAAVRAGALAPAPMTEDEAARAITRRATELAKIDRFSGSVLVVKGDRVLVGLALGQAEKSFAVPNRIDTKFNLGSMNKMFTAVAVGQLVERGKMAFTDSLAKVLPDYPDHAFAERATVHHLLTHTSGIGGNIFAPEVFEHRDRFKRPADYFPIFAKEKPEFPPGERFRYANPGFVVLGAIVERISGENYHDYVRKHIFEPAGMRDTSSFEVDESVPNLAVGYRPDDADPFGLMPRRTNWLMLPYKGTPAGGGYSTVPDLRAFADALRAHKLLGAAMTETVTSAKVDADRPKMRYGYGFFTRVVNGKEVRGHSGGAPGINGALEIFWDGSYTVAVLGNYDPPAAAAFADEIVDFLAAQPTR